MRGQLAKAQRQDPRLLEIINYLQKQPAGSYMSEPRADLRKVKSRALKFRLTSDKLLVARPEIASHDIDLPCIPDVQHESSIPEAPATQTWKHMLLGAVHNTVTGQHRTRQEMHDEVATLLVGFLLSLCLKIVYNGVHDVNFVPVCFRISAMRDTSLP